MSRWTGAFLLALTMWCMAATPCRAVIKNVIPLARVVDEEMIFVAKVDRVDPDRPAVVFVAGDALKGKVPFTRLPINMTGDSEAQREKHGPQIMKRLAPNLNVIVFVSKKGMRYLAFVYSNGTWFQMEGRGTQPDEVKWAFLHGEPYLRRTFKGTTEEMKKAVRDGLAGKPLPGPDEKAEPGFGPEAVPAEPKEKPNSFRYTAGPPFAVAPTFLLVGPLALLATLFPTVFGGLALLMKRWMAALSICCTISTVYFVHAWFFRRLEGTWFGTATGLWATMGGIALIGSLWAARRYRQVVAAGEGETFQPRKWDRIVLAAVSLGGVALIAFAWATKKALIESPWMDLLAFSIPVWAGTIAALRTRSDSPKIGVSVETVFLWALTFACAATAALNLGRSRAYGSGPVLAETSERIPRPAGIAWEHRAKADGSVFSTPVAVGDRLYVAAVQGKGLSQNGAVFCIDSSTGKLIWTFDNDEEMKMVFSSPVHADGKIYIGEGFHEHGDCKLYCLDAADGKKAWEFQTKSHTESTPNVVDGKVYIGAGDDGIWCLDAKTGKPIWNYPGVHVDSRPEVMNGRLYVGSGVGDVYKTTLLLCLDAATGKDIWKIPVDLPAFASPVAADGHVYFGIGNGNVSTSDAQPRGAMLCIEAQSGRRIWQCDARDTILCQPEVDSERVYFTSRDGHCYAVSRINGRIRWKRQLGSPIVAGPALVSDERHPGTVSSVYVVSTAGHVECLDVHTGRTFWAQDFRSLAQAASAANATPVVQLQQVDGIERRRIFIGVQIGTEVSPIAKWYCFEDEVK